MKNKLRNILVSSHTKAAQKNNRMEGIIKFKTLIDTKMHDIGWNTVIGGIGSFGKIYHNEEYPDVIVKTGIDGAYIKFLQWSRYHQYDIHLPRVLYITKVHNSFIAIIEKLDKINKNNKIECYLPSDTYTMLDFVNNNSLCKLENTVYDAPDTVWNTCFNIFKRFKQQLMNNSIIWDTHCSNIMYRDGNIPVIIDPIAPSSNGRLYWIRNNKQ